ncbi:aminotransferase class III-fold pyridoxal phosphate-dependent enzyme [Rhizobium sp. SGZ-381]|uniref:aminotransferase class III-fold pyridoxal phosphate-dependent enzyme n=1 Tax=Rhizobium sp. SGZ-381 TaxID=3342800 RepID=UPI0036729685
MGTVQPDQAQDVREQTIFPDPDDVLARSFGLSGDLRPIPSNPHAYTFSPEDLSYRLDFTDDAEQQARFQGQADLISGLMEGEETIQGPLPIRDIYDEFVVKLAADEDEPSSWARLLRLPDGVALAGDKAPSALEARAFGQFAARLIRALDGESRKDEGRTTPVLTSIHDLRQAGPSVVKLLRAVGDSSVRDPVAKTMVAALRQIQPLGPALRVKIVHHQPVRADVLGERVDGAWHPVSFISADALGEGWIAASLAALCADLLVSGDADILDFLPAVSGFHDELPLLEEELKALWPLTLIRIGLLRAMAEHQAVVAASDETLGARQAARELFSRATAVHAAFVEAAILDAVDWPREGAPKFGLLLPEIEADAIRVVDLSVTSPLFAEGNWQDPDIDWRLLARIAWDSRMGATRFGEYRFSRAQLAGGEEADNYALHVDLCLPAGAVAVAPMGGIVHLVDNRLVLVGKEASLYLEGLDSVLVDGTALFAGDRLGVVAGGEGSVGGLRIRICRAADLLPPLFASARFARLWSRLVLSPSLLLGRDLDAPPTGRQPLARGWQDCVFDGNGRSFVDLSGAAGLLGHGNADMAEAAYRQWMTLAGVQGTQAEADFRDALLRLLPDDYNVVLTVTDEESAMELAEALAGQLAQDGETLVIADERRHGFGRLGATFWRFVRDGEAPDLVVTGSPVPGEPLAAVIAKAVHEDIAVPAPAVPPGAVACRIGCCVLNALTDDASIERADTTARYLGEQLHRIGGWMPELLAVEGEGFTYDLLLPDETLSSFDLARQLAAHGILMPRPQTPDRLPFSAPLCLTHQSVDRLTQALASVLERLRPEAGTLDQPAPSLTDLEDEPV